MLKRENLKIANNKITNALCTSFDPLELVERPRRNRKSDAIRRLVRETSLSPNDFILPLFIMDGVDSKSPIKSMPGVFRLGRKALLETVKEVADLGIPAIALFPVIADNLKDVTASESRNPAGLLQESIRAIKDTVPGVSIITDIALDPFSSDGHDGLLKNGEIVNDPTLELLAAMAVSHAEAGADIVAPSDMMDGRVRAIRSALDSNSFTDVGILAYTAKYASSFYGPFRDALDSAPRSGDKKSYQMDPANSREAVREAMLDISEGADMIMVKPALAYLDVISLLSTETTVPLAAYNVSGEFAMAKAAGQLGWLDADSAIAEMLLAIKRAGADIILSYAAIDFVKKL